VLFHPLFRLFQNNANSAEYCVSGTGAVMPFPGEHKNPKLQKAPFPAGEESFSRERARETAQKHPLIPLWKGERAGASV
jgi:hypothetical protein